MLYGYIAIFVVDEVVVDAIVKVLGLFFCC
jgi:hypothetical protein